MTSKTRILEPSGCRAPSQTCIMGPSNCRGPSGTRSLEPSCCRDPPSRPTRHTRSFSATFSEQMPTISFAKFDNHAKSLGSHIRIKSEPQSGGAAARQRIWAKFLPVTLNPRSRGAYDFITGDPRDTCHPSPSRPAGICAPSPLCAQKSPAAFLHCDLGEMGSNARANGIHEALTMS